MENIVKEIWDEVKMKGNIVQGIYAIEKVFLVFILSMFIMPTTIDIEKIDILRQFFSIFNYVNELKNTNLIVFGPTACLALYIVTRYVYLKIIKYFCYDGDELKQCIAIFITIENVIELIGTILMFLFLLEVTIQYYYTKTICVELFAILNYVGFIITILNDTLEKYYRKIKNLIFK